MAPDIKGKLFALFCAFLWAIAVILFKKSGEKLSPLALNLFKTSVAIILIFPILLFEDLGSIIKNISFLDFTALFISGIVGIAVADSMFFKSLNLIGAGMIAIVDCIYSPMTILLAFLFLAEKITLSSIIGSILVAIAVIIGAYHKAEKNTDLKTSIIGIFYGLFAIFLMVISVIIMKPVLQKTSVLFITEFRFISGLVGIFILIFLKKNRKDIFISSIKKSNFKYALPGTVVGNVIAMILWISAFKLTDINSAAILNQTNTIFIIILATIFLKEKFSFKKFLSTVLAFSGALIAIIF